MPAIKRNCLNCGIEFESTNPKAKCCCEKCSKKYYYNTHYVRTTERKHPDDYFQKNKEVVCKFCGNIFFAKQYDIDAGNGIYCSRECFAKGTTQNIEIECQTCGKKIRISKSRIGVRKFCSRACQHIAAIKPKSEITVIERKRGLSKDWTKSVFKRDNYTCQKCKIRGGKLNAHHIIAFSVDESLRYDINNGITLCEKCHKKLHKELLQTTQTDIFDIKYSNRRKKE